jgi:hypothetical protein
MIRIVLLAMIDASCIVKWNQGKDFDFLTQWSGRGYQYPITVEQINARPAADSAEYKIYAIRENET